jgi:TRAP-type C4-dicarboxylate transport system permease small subunit
MNVIAGAILFFLAFFIVADVLMRWLCHTPILGAFDITEMFGGLLIFLAIPYATVTRQYVCVEFLISNLAPNKQLIVYLFTRVLGVALFVIIGWNLFLKGIDFYQSGEVSPTLKLPLYPATFLAGLCCFVQCSVQIVDELMRALRSRGQ